MNAAVQSNMVGPAPDFSGVEFATSADGLPVARIDDLVLAMVTSPSGIAYLASAVAVRRPLADLTRADFIGHDGRVADEADFRARVAETAGHNHDLAKLNRIPARMSATIQLALQKLRWTTLKDIEASRFLRLAYWGRLWQTGRHLWCSRRPPYSERRSVFPRPIPVAEKGKHLGEPDRSVRAMQRLPGLPETSAPAVGARRSWRRSSSLARSSPTMR